MAYQIEKSVFKKQKIQLTVYNSKIMKKFFLLILIQSSFLFSCKAQGIQQPNLETEIIGSWISNDDPTYKLVFTQNGYEKSYYNNTLSSTFTYSITTECNGQTLTTNYDIFLRVVDTEDNEIYCHFLNGIHTNQNGVKTLSITTERGKLELYTKQ